MPFLSSPTETNMTNPSSAPLVPTTAPSATQPDHSPPTSLSSQPISASTFLSALPSLPLTSLHAKIAELHNSLSHLRDSNTEMLPFAEDGDVDCREAIFENLEVISRFKERIALVEGEIERRKTGGDVNADLVLRNGMNPTREELQGSDVTITRVKLSNEELQQGLEERLNRVREEIRLEREGIERGQTEIVQAEGTVEEGGVYL